ncbi:MAG: enoyl-CoA hydratase/isomerase family protein [Rhizobacter sp.]|nr:enoyl-CoA hydratase/isomerase family protein [Rhizobacter sp.]
MPSELHAERRDASLVLSIRDADSRNTLSAQVFAAGIEALEVSETDDSVRCIVLRGEGEHFCDGLRIRQLGLTGDTDRDVPASTLQHFHDFIEALRVFPKPVIAAVEGAAVDGGFSLALACDLIVAAEGAQFVLAQGRAGLSADGGASWQLMQRLPRSLVLQMLWLCEPMSAERLHAHGIVNWVSPHGQTLAQALSIAQQLSSCAPNAIASAKELVNQWPARSLTEQLEAERSHFLDNLFHLDGGEGLQPRLDMHPPKSS